MDFQLNFDSCTPRCGCGKAPWRRRSVFHQRQQSTRNIISVLHPYRQLPAPLHVLYGVCRPQSSELSPRGELALADTPGINQLSLSCGRGAGAGGSRLRKASARPEYAFSNFGTQDSAHEWDSSESGLNRHALHVQDLREWNPCHLSKSGAFQKPGSSSSGDRGGSSTGSNFCILSL